MFKEKQAEAAKTSEQLIRQALHPNAQLGLLDVVKRHICDSGQGSSTSLSSLFVFPVIKWNNFLSVHSMMVSILGLVL